MRDLLGYIIQHRGLYNNVFFDISIVFFNFLYYNGIKSIDAFYEEQSKKTVRRSQYATVTV